VILSQRPWRSSVCLGRTGALLGIDPANGEAQRRAPMSERDNPTAADANANETHRQPPRLSPEEIERIEAEEDLENLIEAPPEGDLSVISDEDVPGAPG
jgi:hypothetical protein